jgi:3-isopropylmalate/(R)-2-methylmalate dehydratase small subunit
MPSLVSHSPDGDSQEPLPTLEGRALCFGLELPAGVILDATCADRSPADARRQLFAAIDPGLAGRLAAGDIVVAEEITGTIDAARPALAALAAAGVRALVARQFSSAILSAAAATGIATLVVDTPNFLHTDDRVRLDLDAAKVVNLSSGDRSAIRNLSDEERARYRNALAAHPLP